MEIGKGFCTACFVLGILAFIVLVVIICAVADAIPKRKSVVVVRKEYLGIERRIAPW